MKKTIRRTRLTIIAILTLMLIAASALAVSATTRNTDTSKASSGRTMLMVSGKFQKANVKETLKQINGYRLEACKKGYPHPDEDRRLTMDDYNPVKWSGDLEWIAQTRAAEGIVLWDHERPNGKDCFSCVHNGETIDMEALAWVNYGKPLDGPSMWLTERGWYLDGYKSWAGHYISMIDPDVNYVALGCFSRGEYTCIAGEFSYSENLDEKSCGVSGKYDQWIEVRNSHLSGYTVSGSSKVVVGQKETYRFARKATFEGGFEESNKITTPLIMPGSGSWSVSSKSVASINLGGKLKGKKIGKVTVKGKTPGGNKVSKTVRIVKPYKGAVLTIKGSKYKITKLNKEVSYNGGSTGSTVKIPSSVRYYGKTYKVTAVGASALEGKKKVSKLVIGKNVKKIGTDAFRNCKSLKKVSVKSKYLKASRVGSNAFTDSPVRTVLCPGGKKGAYKKIFVKKGVSKEAVFK